VEDGHVVTLSVPPPLTTGAQSRTPERPGD
jgi:hypothetical protein